MVNDHPWQLVLARTCTEGHIIQAKLRMPQAHIAINDQEDGVAVTIAADYCHITYEGAFVENGCLKCLTCGADVPSPIVEALLKSQCPSH